MPFAASPTKSAGRAACIDDASRPNGVPPPAAGEKVPEGRMRGHRRTADGSFLSGGITRRSPWPAPNRPLKFPQLDEWADGWGLTLFDPSHPSPVGSLFFLPEKQTVDRAAWRVLRHDRNTGFQQ